MNKYINEKIGAWLLSEGNTREKLAAEIGISRPALNNRIDGITKWDWDDVVAISRVIGCSLNDLAGISTRIVK